MSRLATEYLQKECTLPRNVTFIESDLANGYLFISLLNQMGHVSEESYEAASDAMDPDIVLENFRILARSLRKLNISLTRKDVANIVSETPGASADLVMKIRASREAQVSGRNLNAPPKYKEVMRSLRPKDFVRQNATGSGDATSKELFFSDARTVLDGGVFAELDMKCHLEEFKVTEYDNEKKGTVQDAQMRDAKAMRRKDTHDATAQFRHTVTVRNAEKDQAITERWAVTEEDKRKRQVRDLQFELATLKIDELRRKKRSNHHRAEQISGIDAFEVSMKRNGIGGGDDGQTLSTTYEDTELFAKRLSTVARQNWPSDDDTSDFVTALKLRTKDNRVARYEKARRKRRAALVEQSAAADVHDSFEDTQDAFEETKRNESLMKATLKQEKLEKSVADGAASREALLEAAEEKIREFSEVFTSRADEIDEERKVALKAVVDAREAKKAEKRRNNDKLVRTIVMEMVSDLFDAGNSTKKGPPLSTADPHLLLNQLGEMARQRMDNAVALDEVTSLESWASHAALSVNIGKWKRRAPAPVTSIDADSTENTEKSEPVGASEADVYRQDSFLETAQTVLETIVQRSREMNDAVASGGSAQNGIAFGLTEENKTVLCSSSKVVVALSNGFSPSRDAWVQVQAWTGERAALWDVVNVVLAGSKIKPLMEGKKPTINFASLVQIFTEERLVCPDSLAGTALPPEIMKGCNELVDISNNILALKDILATSPELPLTNVTFSDVSCGIAVGVSLRIRQFVRDKLAGVNDIDTIMPNLVITARLFGSLYSSDKAIFARVVDWFLQGGTRDDVPESEKDLVAAIASDVGSKGGKKAPPKKGAEVPVPVSALAAVIWIHAKTQNVASRICKPYTGDDTVCVDQVQYLLDSVDLAKSKESLEADLAADGGYLLNYGVLAVEEEPPQPGDVPSKVPVYSMQQKQPSDSANDDVATTINTHLFVTEDLSSAETILSIVLDVYDVVFGFASADATPDAVDADAPVVGSRDALRMAVDRVNHIKNTRRSTLSPQDKIWLCNLTKENVLQSADIFDVHSKISAARAVEVELKGLLVMMASYSCAEVERAVRFLETDFVQALKATDQRWFDNCEQTVKALDTYSLDSEPVILEDLVASLGNTIDDRHMMWLSKLAQMEDSGAGVILDLQGRLLSITELYAKATFEIIESQKVAAVALAQLLEAANYSQVPWGEGSAGVQSKDSASRLNTTVEQFIDSCIGVDVSASVDKTLWVDLVEMELPGGADIKSASLVILHQESISSCQAVLNTVCSSLLEARSTMLDSVNAMKKSAKRRYVYEHEVLSDWGSQLRGMTATPDAPCGRQFLQQFYFGVSDDVLNDQVTSLNGENAIEVGDMHLALDAIAALAEEIAFIAFPNTQLSRNNSAKDDSNSTDPSAGVEKHLSILDAFLETVVLAVKKAVQKGVQMPRSWKNMKRVTNLLGNFASRDTIDPDNTNILEEVATAAREMIVSLLFAATPCSIPVDYIQRLSKTLCQPVENSALLRFPLAADSPTVEFLLAKVKADSKLSVGWWAIHSAADEAKYTVDHTLSVISSIAWMCLDAAGNVHVPTFLLSMCKCPQMHSKASFEKTLLFADAEDAFDQPSTIINDGFYKALRLASRIHADEEEPKEEGTKRDVRMSEAAGQLDALLGTAVSVTQLNWLSQMCGGDAIIPDGSTFRAQIGMGRRAKPVGVTAEPVTSEGKEENEEKETAPEEESKEQAEEESKAAASEEEEEVWEPMDAVPAGVVVPVAAAWSLSGSVRGKSFALAKYCKS